MSYNVKETLMKRDKDKSEEEIDELIEETKQELQEAIESGDFLATDDIMMNNLGLEPDYIDDLVDIY